MRKQRQGGPRNFPRNIPDLTASCASSIWTRVVWAYAICHCPSFITNLLCANNCSVSTNISSLLRCSEMKVNHIGSLCFQKLISSWNRQLPVESSGYKHKHTSTHMHTHAHKSTHIYAHTYTCTWATPAHTYTHIHIHPCKALTLNSLQLLKKVIDPML